jgi:pimeloyl-ACP methyl ester carboxylesterase
VGVIARVSERHAVDVSGGRVCLVLHLPETSAPAPCVVACHGLGASKDSDKYLLLGAELPAAGYALARFDFRGCGESSGREDETTIATRIEDVEAVLKLLGRHPRLSGELGLLGSSLGGFVALHVAALRGDGTPVVTWNAPSHLSDLANDERDDRPGIGVPFLMELASHRYESTPAGVPRHLVIQGEADDVVEVEHGVVLHSRAADPCELLVIPGADHRLTDPEHRRQAVDASVTWFQRFLHPSGRALERPGARESR